MKQVPYKTLYNEKGIFILNSAICNSMTTLKTFINQDITLNIFCLEYNQFSGSHSRICIKLSNNKKLLN